MAKRPREDLASSAAADFGFSAMKAFGAAVGNPNSSNVTSPNTAASSSASAAAAAAFTYARKPYFPAEGHPITLDTAAQFDQPVEGAPLEAWHYHCHLRAVKKNENGTENSSNNSDSDDCADLTVMASFFQGRAFGKSQTACAWALSDVANEVYFADSLLEPKALRVLQHHLDPTYTGRKPQHAEGPLLEMIKEGRLPRPDRLMKSAPIIAKDGLDLNLDGDCQLRKVSTTKDTNTSDVNGNKTAASSSIPTIDAAAAAGVSSSYTLHLNNPSKGICCDLTFTPLNQSHPPVPHGNNGDGLLAGTEMFNYYFPRCAVTGTIIRKTRTSNNVKSAEDDKEATEETTTTINVEGSGWYEREFGGTDNPAQVAAAAAFDPSVSLSLQISNGVECSELSIVTVLDRSNHAVEKEKVAVLTTSSSSSNHSASSSSSSIARDVTMVPYDPSSMTWTSLNTFTEYPLAWHVTVPSLGVDMKIVSAFKNQEFMTVLGAGGGYYHGRVKLLEVNDSKNTIRGQPIAATATQKKSATTTTTTTTVIGVLKRRNFVNYNDTNGLMKSVGRLVKSVLGTMYPLSTTQDYVNTVCLGRHCTQRGVPAQVVCDTLFKPVRALIDRGGKAWRTLILLAAIGALSDDGGRQQHDCTKYIAISDLLHVGSLIIDDIQDDSLIRRGGKCVHLDYGVATAINAGTGCYFMAPRLAGFEEMAPAMGFKLYNLYFDAMKAGHAGQGLDINGLNYLMPAVVESGDADILYDALQAIHVYKSGSVVGTLCAMACVICGASAATEKGLSEFGTQLGLAFQIVDDALNLRGFEGDLKEAGEDIRDGKITYPIIKAMGRIDAKAEREYIWAVLQEKTSDIAKIGSVIEKLNAVKAIADCLSEARELVESAWRTLDPLLEDSLPKIFIRTFCNYLTERTL